MADKIFTDEEIAEIVKLLDATRRTQYIGARYVPVFGRKGEASVEWDNSAPYEPLTIVLHQGSSFTSRQHVPAGVDINDGNFWAQTGSYNAQVEAYRQDVVNMGRRVTQVEADTEANADAITNANTVITGIRESLEALGAGDKADAAALKTTIDGLGVDVASINERLSHTGVIDFLDYRQSGRSDDDTMDVILALPDVTGKTLYFPAGTYEFGRRHVLPPTFRVMGDGFASVIKWTTAPSTSGGDGPFRVEHGDGIEISHLSFTSELAMPTGPNDTAESHNIYLVTVAQDGSHDIYLHDIDVKRYMLLLCGVPHESTTTPNCNVTVAYVTAHAWPCNSELPHDITSAVVEIYNTNNFRVTGCNFVNEQYWGGGCGVQCWGGSSIDKETFRGGGTWLNGFAIDHNVIGSTQWSPIYTACAADGIICGNVCYDCSDGCMSIEGARNVVITGNVLRDSNNYCIALANAMDNVVFADNVLSQSGEPGRAGSQTQEGTTPRKRFRMVSRWGVVVNEDTSAHQSLTISGNKFVYHGSTETVADGATVGTIEVGGDSGILRFVDNDLINCFLSTFQKSITGAWGIADFQNRYFRPCRTVVRGNTFMFDDADMRVAQEGSPLRDVCMYVSNPLGSDIEVSDNEILTKTYALKASPVELRHIYVTRTAGADTYTEEKSQNKGGFIFCDNNISGFDKITKITNDSNIISQDVIYRNNIFTTSVDRVFVKSTGNTTNLFAIDNYVRLYNKTSGGIGYVTPLIDKVPAKGSVLDALMPVGVTLTFFGQQPLGTSQYHTVTKRSGGWQGVGELGPIVADY